MMAVIREADRRLGQWTGDFVPGGWGMRRYEHVQQVNFTWAAVKAASASFPEGTDGEPTRTLFSWSVCPLRMP